MVRETGKAFLFRWMAQGLKAISKMTCAMAKEHSTMQMVTHTQESGYTIKSMEKELTCMQME